LHGFSGPFGLKWGFVGQNRERGGAILTLNELVLPFGGTYVCANFGENRSRNATVRVFADGQTDRQTDRLYDRLTDANRFYNLSYAIYAIAMGQIKTQNRGYYAAQCNGKAHSRLPICVN